jgi:hypothetical protein
MNNAGAGRSSSATQRPWGQQVSGEMQECIQNCLDCHAICLETAAYCMQLGGKHAEPSHLRLLPGLCADMCYQCRLHAEAVGSARTHLWSLC